MQRWLEFIESLQAKIIKKDQWNMFLELVTTTKGDLANFEDDGCWPSIVDEFIAFNE